MKFKISRASDWDNEWEVEINTLEDLLDLMKKEDSKIILYGYENTTTSTMTVQYWQGNTFASVGSKTDGTTSDGATLGQSGWVTINSDTLASEQPFIICGYYLYFYVFNWKDWKEKFLIFSGS